MRRGYKLERGRGSPCLPTRTLAPGGGDHIDFIRQHSGADQDIRCAPTTPQSIIHRHDKPPNPEASRLKPIEAGIERSVASASSASYLS